MGEQDVEWLGNEGKRRGSHLSLVPWVTKSTIIRKSGSFRQLCPSPLSVDCKWKSLASPLHPGTVAFPPSSFQTSRNRLSRIPFHVVGSEAHWQQLSNGHLHELSL